MLKPHQIIECTCGQHGEYPADHKAWCPVFAAAHVGDGRFPRFRVGDVVRTRDGRPARIVADDLAGNRPLVVAVSNPDGAGEVVVSYPLDGRYCQGSMSGQYTEEDLVAAKGPPRSAVVWLLGRWGDDGTPSFEVHSGDRPEIDFDKQRFRIRVEVVEGRFDE